MRIRPRSYSVRTRRRVVRSAELARNTPQRVSAAEANSLLAVLNFRRGILDKSMSGYDMGSFGLQVVDARYGIEEMRPDRHELRAIKFRSPLNLKRDPQPRPDSERMLSMEVGSGAFFRVSREQTPPIASKI
ncbi:hypothetical protein C8Q79DRAFT_468673 [Trametes meyenii]|nr:hypothetical protein C8Q79DRAFT_468673 [Trametes meyenii]